VNARWSFTAAAAFAMIACASVGFSRTGEAPAGTDSATIARLEQRWVVAVSPGGDRGTLEQILADDYVDTDWQGHTRNKADLLRAPAAKGATEQVTDLHVRTWGDTAVATGINHMHSSAKGWSVDVAFTDVFSRIDGHWRAVSSQETLRKPALSAH